MNSNKLTYIEIKADVFRILRANGDKSTNTVFRMIKDHFPTVPNKVLLKALYELSEN